MPEDNRPIRTIHVLKGKGGGNKVVATNMTKAIEVFKAKGISIESQITKYINAYDLLMKEETTIFAEGMKNIRNIEPRKTCEIPKQSILAIAGTTPKLSP